MGDALTEAEALYIQAAGMALEHASTTPSQRELLRTRFVYSTDIPVTPAYVQFVTNESWWCGALNTHIL
jgi:hypothetical protein